MSRHATVDKVAVRVFPDATRFAEQMKRWTDRPWKTNIEAMLDADRARDQMRRFTSTPRDALVQAKLDDRHAREELAKLNRLKTYATVQIHDETAKAGFDRITHRMEDLNKRKVALNIETKDLRRAQAEFDKLSHAGGDVGLKAFADLDRVTQRLHAIKDEIKDIDRLHPNVTIDVKKAETELKRLTHTRYELDIRVDEAERHLDGVQDKLRAIGDRHDALHLEDKSLRAAKSALEEIKSKLTAVDVVARKAAQTAWFDGHGADELERIRLRLAEVKAEMKSLDKDKIEVSLDTKKAKEELRHLTDDQKIKVEAELEAKMARARLAMLTRNRVINVFMKLSTAQFTQELTNLMRGMSGLAMLGDWRKKMAAWFADLPSHTIKFTKLATAVGTVGAVAGSLLGTIAPLGRGLKSIAPAVLFAIPAMGGLAASVGVVIAAFKGLSDSTVWAAQQFSHAWDGVKDDLSGVKAVIQGEFFSEEFTTSFTNLSNRILPDLRSGLQLTAGALSRFGSTAMDAWRDALDDGALTVFFQHLATGINRSQGGIRGFLTGLTHLSTKGSEVFGEVGDWLTKMGEKFAAWTAKADIAGMMRTAATQTGYLITLTKNLGGVIAGLFHAMDTGKSTGLESAANRMGRIRDIINSQRFQTAMHNVFRGAATGADALHAALGPIGDRLERLSGLAGGFFTIMGRTGAAVLQGITDMLSRPVAQQGLLAAFQGFSTLATSIPWGVLSSALGGVGQLLGDMAPVVATILNQAAPLLPRNRNAPPCHRSLPGMPIKSMS